MLLALLVGLPLALALERLPARHTLKVLLLDLLLGFLQQLLGLAHLGPVGDRVGVVLELRCVGGPGARLLLGSCVALGAGFLLLRLRVGRVAGVALADEGDEVLHGGVELADAVFAELLVFLLHEALDLAVGRVRGAVLVHGGEGLDGREAAPDVVEVAHDAAALEGVLLVAEGRVVGDGDALVVGGALLLVGQLVEGLAHEAEEAGGGIGEVDVGAELAHHAGDVLGGGDLHVVLVVVAAGTPAIAAAQDVALVGIVPGALLGVGEDLVGGGDVREQGGGALDVAIVAVGVQLEGLAAVGLLDLVVGCSALDAEQLVVAGLDLGLGRILAVAVAGGLLGAHGRAGFGAAPKSFPSTCVGWQVFMCTEVRMTLRGGR